MKSIKEIWNESAEQYFKDMMGTLWCAEVQKQWSGKSVTVMTPILFPGSINPSSQKPMSKFIKYDGRELKEGMVIRLGGMEMDLAEPSGSSWGQKVEWICSFRDGTHRHIVMPRCLGWFPGLEIEIDNIQISPEAANLINEWIKKHEFNKEAFVSDLSMTNFWKGVLSEDLKAFIDSITKENS
jgi:hypothetical protein